MVIIYKKNIFLFFLFYFLCFQLSLCGTQSILYMIKDIDYMKRKKWISLEDLKQIVQDGLIFY